MQRNEIKKCPYCRVALSLLYDEDRYRCIICGREFYEQGGKLIPSVMRNALVLRKNIRTAEEAYPEALKILKNLDKEANRKFVAHALNEAGYNEVRSSDFVGAKLKISKERDKYMREYGVRTYPLIIVMSPGKSAEMKKKFRNNPNVNMGGVSITVDDWPFSVLGGIRLSFSGRSTTEEHEVLHGTFEIYRGGRERYYLPHEEAESYLLNEINSFRSNVLNECGYDLKNGNYKVVENYWNNNIKKRILGHYIPKITKAIKDAKMKEYVKNILKKHIEETMPIFAKLQIEYDDTVLTRILMKSRDFHDVKSWSKRRDTLKQWQERAILAREREVRKRIADLCMGGYNNLPVFLRINIKREVYHMVSDYWRFIGNPKDYGGRSKYVEKLIKEIVKEKGGEEALKKLVEEVKKEGLEELEELTKIVKEGGGESEKQKERLKKLAKEVKEG